MKSMEFSVEPPKSEKSSRISPISMQFLFSPFTERGPPCGRRAPGRGISWNSERFCTDFAEFRGGGRKGQCYPLRVSAPDREFTKTRENSLNFGEFARCSHFQSHTLPVVGSGGTRNSTISAKILRNSREIPGGRMLQNVTK